MHLEQPVSGLNGPGRWRGIRRVLLVVLLLNIAVAVAKAVYGWLTHSVSMVADGFHSLFDGSSNVVGLVGIWLAARPADPDHPYGHTKYESFASMGIAAMLLFAAYGIARAAIGRLSGGPQVIVDAGSFAVMIGTIAVNLTVTTYERRRGNTLNSSILVADAMHTRSDVFVSLSVIAGLIAVRLGFPIMDLVVAGFVVLAILKAAWDVVRAAGDVLVDSARLPEDELRALAEAVPGIRSCHKIRTRGAPNEVYVDLHVVVDPSTPLECAHAVASEVEVRIRANYPQVVEVLVHPEPR